MSYEICYSRNFIKTHRGIIPLILTGSNNGFEWTGRRWRRERDWSCFYGNKHIELSESDLLKFFDEVKDKDKNYDFCDYRGKRLYWNDAFKFYQKGIKGARTLEDYIAEAHYTNAKGRTWRVNCLEAYVSDWNEGKHGEQSLNRDLKTTADLEAWLDEARDFVGNDKNKYICLGFDSKEPVAFKKQGTIKGECVLKIGNEYIVEADSRHFQTTGNKEEAKHFTSEQEAREYLEGIKTTWGHYYFKTSICNYDVNKKEPVKNCYVRIDKYNTFARFTKYGYRYYHAIGRIKDALMTEKRAKQVVEKLRNLFSDKHTFEIVKEEA